MFKTYSVLFFFLLLTNLGFGQTREIDSVKQIVSNEQIDTVKISKYLWIAKEYMSINVDSLHFYNEKALSLSLKNNEYLLARIYNNKGLSLIYRSKADSARYYLDKSLEIVKIKNNKKIKSTVLANYAMSYQIDNDLENMAKYNLAAIEASEGNDKELCRLYYNQGIILGHSELMNEAKKYFMLAFNTSFKMKNSTFEALAAKGLGHVYFTEKKLDSAKIYLDRAIVLCEETNDPQICYEANSKIGELYDLLNQPEKAEDSFKKALKYAKIRNSIYDIMAINIFLGEHELKKKNYKKAVGYFNSFDKSYAKYPEPSLRTEALRFWAKSEEGAGNFKKSMLLFEEYVQIKDSLFQLKIDKQLPMLKPNTNPKKKTKKSPNSNWHWLIKTSN